MDIFSLYLYRRSQHTYKIFNPGTFKISNSNVQSRKTYANWDIMNIFTLKEFQAFYYNTSNI